jgi:hypothetical protein
MKGARTDVKQVYKVNPPVQVGSYRITRLGISPYQHGQGSALVALDDDSPLCHLSKNIQEHNHELGPMEFFIKAYSEAEPFVAALTASDRPILLPIGDAIPQGFAEVIPCRLQLKYVNTRFNCPTCKKTFPTHQAHEWDETRLLYCSSCMKLMDDDFDVDIDFSAAEPDEKKIKTRKT